MGNFSVEEIRTYIQTNPEKCKGKSQEEIVSIMSKDSDYVSLSKNQQVSLFYPHPIDKDMQQTWSNDVALITSQDIQNKQYFILSGEYNINTEADKITAYNYLNEIFTNAQENFDTQRAMEGWVSDLVNYTREKFNAESSRNKVENALKDTKSDLEFLDAAMRGSLINGNNENIEFEEAFNTLRGVKYSPKKIEQCQKEAEAYMFADMVNSGLDNLINNLNKYSYGSTDLNYPKEFNKNALKTFAQLGIKNKSDINSILEAFNEASGGEYKLLELGSKDKKYYKQNFAIMHKNPDGRYLPLNPEQAKTLGEFLTEKLHSTKLEILGLPQDATAEDCNNQVTKLKNNYKSAFKDAYGTKELTALSEEYIIAQQKGVGYVHMGVSVGAMVLAAFTGGASATVATAVAMTQPTQLLEQGTNADGLTKDDLLNHGKMLLQQLPWMAAGMGMGKIGDLSRSFVKLKGLQSLANKAGQSLDDYVNLMSTTGNLTDDIAKALKSTRILAETAGVSTEFALDMATTLAIYKDAKSEDWLMAFAGALAGSAMNAKLSKMSTPDMKVQYLVDTFKEIKLTPDEAQKILNSMETDKIKSEATKESAAAEINPQKERREYYRKKIDEFKKREADKGTQQRLDDIYYGLIQIEDLKIQDKVIEYINDYKLSSAEALVDAINNINGNYLTLKTTYYSDKTLQKWSVKNQESKHKWSDTTSYNFIKYLQKNGYTVEDLINNKIPKSFFEKSSINRADFKFVAKDLKFQQKFNRMEEFISKDPYEEISNYLYENYYLKPLQEKNLETVRKLKELNDDYNVKVFIRSPNKETNNALNMIRDEFIDMQKISAGKAKLPPVIIFNKAISNWYDDTSAYGKSVSGAYSSPGYNGSLTFPTHKITRKTLRHELTHTNDLKRIKNFDDDFVYKENDNIVAEKSKYYDEFVKIGINKSHISYAYNNPKEFIAVAAEGDLTLCSPEFKQQLIDFGMPEWMFKISQTTWMDDFTF